MIASAETAPSAANVIIERLLIIVLPLGGCALLRQNSTDTRTFVSEGSNQSPVNKTFEDC
jgi:hypothetical protein